MWSRVHDLLPLALRGPGRDGPKNCTRGGRSLRKESGPVGKSAPPANGMEGQDRPVSTVARVWAARVARIVGSASSPGP